MASLRPERTGRLRRLRVHVASPPATHLRLSSDHRPGRFDLAGDHIAATRGIPGGWPSNTVDDTSSPMDLSGNQIRAHFTDRLLRDSRFGAHHQFIWNSASRYVGRLRPGIPLGPDRSARALPGVPPLAHQPHANRPALANFSAVVWHRAHVRQGARVAARYGNPDELLRHATLAPPGSILE